MTQVLSITAGVVAAVVSLVILNILGVPETVQHVVSLGLAVVVTLVWTYSPLPDHNGGLLAGTGNTGWGW